MAKRRKLEAPSAEDLAELERGFRGETSPKTTRAPIADVAREAAEFSAVVSSEDRARDAEIQAFRDKDDKGLVLTEIPLAEVNAMEIFRDRTVLERGELDELKHSIALNGQRLPIEVYPLKRQDERYKYGLISGYRRLFALREMHDLTPDLYGTVKAIVRDIDSTQDSLIAMIEENEIRADVSHFERGRVAALAAQSKFFPNLEAAVDALYPVASKAKRSKIRSFALVFEELGDVLEFPETLTEKQGLKLASALRDGHDRVLREAAGEAVPESPADEWALLDSVLSDLIAEPTAKAAARGGRPKKPKPLRRNRRTTAGYEINWGEDNGAYVIQVTGKDMDRKMLEDLVDHVAYLLGKPD